MHDEKTNARVWFDLARAGNFPSVASNVLAALILSSPEPGSLTTWPNGSVLALSIFGGCLIYAGGATFNDVADADFDSRHRRERAIPRGAVSRATAAWVAAVEMLVGLGILIALGCSPLWAAGLAATILAYDWIHKCWIGSVVLMAGCRVLLACTLASLPGHVAGGAFIAWISVLFAYIVTLSLIARWEYAPGAPAAKLGRAVGRLLAFIPLIDAATLLFGGVWAPAMACAAAVPLGRWAQRLAAST